MTRVKGVCSNTYHTIVRFRFVAKTFSWPTWQEQRANNIVPSVCKRSGVFSFVIFAFGLPVPYRRYICRINLARHSQLNINISLFCKSTNRRYGCENIFNKKISNCSRRRTLSGQNNIGDGEHPIVIFCS